MKLRDLEPHWIELNNWVSSSQFYVGVSFLCPHCDASAPDHGPNRRRRLAVKFWPPIDPDGLLAKMMCPPVPEGHKRVSGDSFDTLTLHPSVGFDFIGHWHGRITNGECT